MTIKTYRGPNGLNLMIDTSDAATPAMVRYKNECATYDCANDGGELDEGYQLNPAQSAWLESMRNVAEDAYNVARKDNPDYQ